ncbi:hypothetical protein SteCoe_14965 [Stentor coeruleus]|uniref:Uncharacterized protein n=1 Tax=Stentor coeruleus TaxID=5963 RepID=A0A1R2C4S3_9CILI|nr:hypothetical protein SteCoe_14965 [Stentor coeruleus]
MGNCTKGKSKGHRLRDNLLISSERLNYLQRKDENSLSTFKEELEKLLRSSKIHQAIVRSRHIMDLENEILLIEVMKGLVKNLLFQINNSNEALSTGTSRGDLISLIFASEIVCIEELVKFKNECLKRFSSNFVKSAKENSGKEVNSNVLKYTSNRNISDNDVNVWMKTFADSKGIDL